MQKGLIMMKRLQKLALSMTTAGLTAPFCAMTVFAEESTTDSTTSSGWTSIIFLVLMFVMLYFILIRPQRKKDKETKAMQRSLQVGDEIVTIGGIVGLVVKTSEDNVVIETTGNGNKIRIKSWAIQENVTVSENAKRAQEEKLAAAKAKQEEKATKKKKKKGDDGDDTGDSFLKD